jgi:MscS family membrane protein
MKRQLHFIVRIISSILIILSLQLHAGGTTTEINPIAPPPTNSPQETYSAFMANMENSYTLIMKAVEQSNAESGFFASDEVLDLAHQAEEAMERAIKTLDVQNIPKVNRVSKSIESALLLREVFDRIEKPNILKIPNHQDVEVSGLTRWQIPKTQLKIVQQVEGFRKDEFLFSAETIRRLPRFYQEIKDLPYKPEALEGFYTFYVSTPGSLLPPKWSRFLPEWSTQSLLDQTIWQWTVLALLLLLSFTLFYLVYRLLKASSDALNDRVPAWKGIILPSVSGLITLVARLLVQDVINITGDVLLGISSALEVCLYISLAWLSFMFFNALGRTIVANPYFDEEHLLEATVVRNGFRVLGLIASSLLLYIGGNAVGLPTQVLLGSLGVGGLAISFGVQPYVKNLIGGITLFASRPVKIGDFCEFGGVTGTVEDIGLRSTSMRTVDQSLVIIPNSQVSENQVVNYSRRDRRLLQFTIGVRYETHRQQIITITDQIKTYLRDHSLIVDERVRFIGLGDASLDIEIYAYVLTLSYAEFLEVKEALLLHIMEIVETVGSDFAFPSSTVYMARDAGITGGMTETTVASVPNHPVQPNPTRVPGDESET